MSRIIFITGTDTGVGKTTVARLLLRHLRNSGINALAMKPFCSGGTDDLDAFRSIQGDELPRKILNPYYFPEPLAPAVARHETARRITLKSVLATVKKAARRCECLLVEGAGGLLVPVTRRMMVADIISALKCDVIVVTRNQIGTLNHTLLTVEALRRRGIGRIKIVFSETKQTDASSKSNPQYLSEHLKNIGVYRIPQFSSRSHNELSKITGAKKIKKTLAQICDPDTFSPRCSDR